MDLNQMNVDPREALAVGALAHDLLKPRRVEDLEAFLAQHPEVAQYIEQYLGFGYASIPPDLVSGLGTALQTQQGVVRAGQPAPTEVMGAFAAPMGVLNEEGDTQPEPRLDAGLF